MEGGERNLKRDQGGARSCAQSDDLVMKNGRPRSEACGGKHLLSWNFGSAGLG